MVQKTYFTMAKLNSVYFYADCALENSSIFGPRVSVLSIQINISWPNQT